MHSTDGLSGCKYYGERFSGDMGFFSVGANVGVKIKGEH